MLGGLAPIGQLKEWTCGPASLRWILEQHGVRLSETYLASLCETTREGTNHGPLARAARLMGFTARSGSGGSIYELPPGRTIVGWDAAKVPGKDPIDDHYSVLLKATDRWLYLMDPWPVRKGEIRRIDVEIFLKRWYDRTAKNRAVSKWWLVLTPGRQEKIDPVLDNR